MPVKKERERGHAWQTEPDREKRDGETEKESYEQREAKTEREQRRARAAHSDKDSETAGEKHRKLLPLKEREGGWQYDVEAAVERAYGSTESRELLAYDLILRLSAPSLLRSQSSSHPSHKFSRARAPPFSRRV
eukprot:2679336-Rhodomonas_salina.1